MTADEFEIPLSDGAALVARHLPRPGAPRVVFSHGAGLAIGAYPDFVDRLATRYELVAVDLRGHGESVAARLPETGILDCLTRDMAEIRRHLDRVLRPAPTAGVFHSISGVLALLDVLESGRRWAALALLDPPLTPPDSHPLSALKREATAIMVRRVEKRRSTFAAVADFAADLARRDAFAGLAPGGHEAFAAATLCRAEAASDEATAFRLRVTPAAEAAIYRENVLPDLALRLRGFPVPLRFICSDPAGPRASPIPTLCAAIARDADIGIEVIGETTHMLPMERPDACMDAVVGFLARNGLPPPA